MKYILKKEYPGSPKLGNIIDNLENDWIENYPEFWKLVVEKNYEILSVITNNNKFIEKVYNQDATIEPYWKIHSVKRLSDGEIFTIGDKINCNCLSKKEINNTFISSFNVINNNIRVYDNFNEFHLLKDIQKLKQPIFQTEDGVDIFEGDVYYELITPDFHNKSCIWNILPNKTRDNIKYDQEGNRRNGRIWFSTKEKAEEYILMNEPVLSLKDVASIYISADKPVTDTTSFSAQNRRIQDLVKSKIQQSV